MNARMSVVLFIAVPLTSCGAPARTHESPRPATAGELCDALKSHLRSAKAGIIRGDLVVPSRSEICGDSELRRGLRDDAPPEFRLYFANGARFVGFIRLQVIDGKLVNVTFQEGSFEVRTGRECHIERLE